MKKQAFNPYLPLWEYSPDGEPYVFDGRVYVYCSHDYYNGPVFCSGDYMGWSAPADDLSDWRCEGVIYPRLADPANDGGMNLYAPDVTKGPDGRYYLYYVLDKVGFVSVAVCDSPAGRYQFLGYVRYKDGTRLGEREGDEPQFDPGVLTEGDRTFLYTGFCGRGDKGRHGAMCTVLGPDMVTIEEEPVFVAPGSVYSAGTGFEGHAFFEASSIRKRGDTYYFVYSSEVMHELCWATAADPRGPFAYGGVIVSNCDIGIGTYKEANRPMAWGGNNHGSIVEIGGQWYVFWHRQTNGHWFSRQGCAEPIRFDEEGRILQAEITSCGLNGGPLRGEGDYPAAIACHLFAPDMKLYAGEPGQPRIVRDGPEDRSEGWIEGLREGTTAGWRSFDCRGVRRVEVVTRGYGHGAFLVKNAPDGPVLGRIPAESSNVWARHGADIAFPDGVQALYLSWEGSGSLQLRTVGFRG